MIPHAYVSPTRLTSTPPLGAVEPIFGGRTRTRVFLRQNVTRVWASDDGLSCINVSRSGETMSAAAHFVQVVTDIRQHLELKLSLPAIDERLVRVV